MSAPRVEFFSYRIEQPAAPQMQLFDSDAVRREGAGRVTGITAQFEGSDINIQARKGVTICTGGHTSNVEFRRMFAPRLTG